MESIVFRPSMKCIQSCLIECGTDLYLSNDKFLLQVLCIINFDIIVYGDKRSSGSKILEVFFKMCYLLTIFASLIALKGKYLKTSNAECLKFIIDF